MRSTSFPLVFLCLTSQTGQTEPILRPPLLVPRLPVAPRHSIIAGSPTSAPLFRFGTSQQRRNTIFIQSSSNLSTLLDQTIPLIDKDFLRTIPAGLSPCDFSVCLFCHILITKMCSEIGIYYSDQSFLFWWKEEASGNCSGSSRSKLLLIVNAHLPFSVRQLRVREQKLQECCRVHCMVSVLYQWE